MKAEDFSLAGAVFTLSGIERAQGRGLVITQVVLQDSRARLEFNVQEAMRVGTRVFLVAPKERGEVGRLRLVETYGWWSNIREVPLCL